jgi:hypothetical protein
MYLTKAFAAAMTGLLLFAGAIKGGDYPTYKEGVLTIPSASTDNQVGQYQDAVLQLNAQGVWQLTSVNVLGGVSNECGHRAVKSTGACRSTLFHAID